MSAPELPIVTDRLTLRAHRADDVAPLQAIYSLPEVARYIPDVPWTMELAEQKVAERQLKNDLNGDSAAMWLVIEIDGEIAGNILFWLTDRENRVAEIGWVLSPAFEGRGIASEAARAMLRHGFEQHGVHRVAARLDARNHASARLAEAIGMQREGQLRQDFFSKGEWVDTVIYGLLANDARKP